ncbi:MAG: hypothetical protein CL928_03620 [Deltaproteobacteria bacterium]|nr:hypothetical protein [Deltaproteobacteria bacterium]
MKARVYYPWLMNPSRSPIEGGRRPGDDPFLPQSSAQMLSAVFLVVVTVAGVLVLLRGAGSVADESDEQPAGSVEASAEAPVAPLAVEGQLAAPPTKAPGPGGWTGPAGTAQEGSTPSLDATTAAAGPTGGDSPPPLGLSTTRLMGADGGQRAAHRSFQSRRRLLLSEAERMLRGLPDDSVATPEQRRDRRALEKLIRDMDSPAR